MNKLISLSLISLCFIFVCPAYAEHTNIISFSCSDRAKQDMLFVQNTVEKEGYEVPILVTCDVKSAEDFYNKNPIPNLPFEKVAGYTTITASSVYDSIFIREDTEKMSFSRAFIHELGHYNHKIKIGHNKFIQYSREPVPENLKPLIIKNMRAYATSSKTEFVAEYFAYTHLGYKFPKELKNLYKKYGGP